MSSDFAEHPAPSGSGPQAPEPAAPRGERALALTLGVLRLGPGVILVVIVVVMSFLSPYFLTERNLQNLGQQTAIVAMLAMGQFMVILVRGIDISVGSVVSLSAILGITLAGSTHIAVIPLMILTGATVGFVNALLIVKGRLPQPLVVTLASMGAASGIALLVSHGEVKSEVPAAVRWAGQSFAGPIPVPVLLVAAFGLLFWLLTARTQWGRWTYAVGGNAESAKRLGIPANKVVMTGYVLAGTMAGVAGVLSAGRTGTADPFAGAGLELDAITAVVIGGASLFGGRGTIGGAIVGALVLTSIRNGLDLRSVSPYWQTVVQGAIVVIALELDAVRRIVEELLQVRQTRRRA
jgi:ribose transport system permease protein